MKITDIQAQKKSETRFSLFIDGKYSFSLPIEEIQTRNLQVGTELEEFEIEKLKKVSDDSLLLAKAIEKALRRPHSVREIEIFLKQKKAEPELINQAIEKLTKLSLLDDAEFAKRWFEIRKKSNKSNRYITGELKSKGVASEYINIALEASTNDDDSLATLVQKKRKRYPEDQKLIEYLARKGFGFSEIKDAISKIEED